MCVKLPLPNCDLDAGNMHSTMPSGIPLGQVGGWENSFFAAFTASSFTWQQARERRRAQTTSATKVLHSLLTLHAFAANPANRDSSKPVHVPQAHKRCSFKASGVRVGCFRASCSSTRDRFPYLRTGNSQVRRLDRQARLVAWARLLKQHELACTIRLGFRQTSGTSQTRIWSPFHNLSPPHHNPAPLRERINGWVQMLRLFARNL